MTLPRSVIGASDCNSTVAVICFYYTDRDSLNLTRATIQLQSVTILKNFARGRKSAFHASSGM